MAGFTTKELSKKTWPDYQRFFSQGNGWDHCGCTAYHGIRAPREVRKWADKRDFNLKVKCDLVEQRRAHGILVYADGEPVGWCQFGPKEELPIVDNRRTAKLFPDEAREQVWRITCFCTHKQYRQQGVAELALRAALNAIRKQGGGLVEAFPVVTMPPDPELDELIRSHGGGSAEVRQHLMERTGATGVTYYDHRPFSVDGVSVQGLGPVTALVRRMAGALHPGTVAMFEREGFKAKAVMEGRRRALPYDRLLMQRTVRGVPRRRPMG